MRFITVLLVLIQTCTGLRILLTTTDSWVSKNVRFMYESLKEDGHDVKMVAPLYARSQGTRRSKHDKSGSRGENPIAPDTNEINGGEFGHLLPVHQTYYANVRKINEEAQAPRGAKGVVRQKKHKPTKEEKQLRREKHRQEIIVNKHYGSDPLDDDVWFVNAGALDSLVIGLDVISPELGFEPELVLIGPNEGAAWTPRTHNAGALRKHRGRTAAIVMLDYCMSKKIPSLAVSTQDSHHVYYQDEKYFNIEGSSQPLKNNVFGKNIAFVNQRTKHIINNVGLDNTTALNVIFPSINHDESHCFTSTRSTSPKFVQIESESVPETVPFPRNDQTDSLQKPKPAHRFENSVESQVLAHCGIAVNVISKELGSGINRSVIDIEEMLQPV